VSLVMYVFVEQASRETFVRRRRSRGPTLLTLALTRLGLGLGDVGDVVVAIERTGGAKALKRRRVNMGECMYVCM